MQIVKSRSIHELLPIIKVKTDNGGSMFSDVFRTYGWLVNYDYKRHYKVNYSTHEFANERNHINDIENFWRLCKVQRTQFIGVCKKTSIYTLKSVNSDIIVEIKIYRYFG